jgi:hypothetical protein
MTDTFYSPIITLGGRLTTVHKEKPLGIFQFIRVNRAAMLRHFCEK